MNTEKLKGKCRWCRYHLESREMYDKMCLLCKKMNAEYELKWELHPDIADTETTELKDYTDKIPLGEEHFFEQKMLVTSCCNYGPIQDENYCPSCGRRIVKH